MNLIKALEGTTVYARNVPEGGLWVALNGEGVFIAKGEPRNSKEAIVAAWPELFSDQPKSRVIAPTLVR